MNPRAADVLIVGGGLVGLGIGWQAAKGGLRVAVLERDVESAPPSAASRAAAGMLAPLAEAGFHEPALLALGRASLEMYPAFVAELEADAGLGVDLRTEGTLIAALDRDDAAWLRRQYDYQQEIGLPTEWLTGAEAREREARLAPAVTAAIWSPGDHQVDNRLLWRALRTAFVAAGGKLHGGTEAIRIAREGGRCTGVRVREGDEETLLRAPVTVVCAGAWSRLLLRDLAPDSIPPVRPVKGQLLSLEMGPLLRLEHVIRTRRVYLAPKGDGRLIVGATSEEVGFDTRITAGGLLELLRDAWEAVPGVYDLPVRETWAGLRPGSRDGAPILGPTPLDGLLLATGHGRNGVLLTPVTARCMADLLLTGRVPEAIRPFGIERFRRRTAASA